MSSGFTISDNGKRSGINFYLLSFPLVDAPKCQDVPNALPKKLVTWFSCRTRPPERRVSKSSEKKRKLTKTKETGLNLSFIKSHNAQIYRLSNHTMRVGFAATNRLHCLSISLDFENDSSSLNVDVL